MDIEARIARLEAESQIRQLIARYCFTIDERDLPNVAALFTDDAVVRSADGVMNATGIDAIMEQYQGRFKALGPGMHFMHDIQIDFVGDGTQEAHGKVAGHAELERNGKMMMVGLHYRDVYRNTAKGWKFADRNIHFLYYIDAADYPTIMLQRDRNRAYDSPKPADFPEGLATWKSYEAAHG
ncbi:nuclear transport factor 2 family protein [Sphingomonas sp. 1P06PA]|uniref:nuclear transport factor 2 family protein n=1 Tax=Sphingomonas sp. 1P06PA TaxID=554121 RepID=UPI0039A4797C